MRDGVEPFLDFGDIGGDGGEIFFELWRPSFEVFADGFLFCDVFLKVLEEFLI